MIPNQRRINDDRGENYPTKDLDFRRYISILIKIEVLINRATNQCEGGEWRERFL